MYCLPLNPAPQPASNDRSLTSITASCPFYLQFSQLMNNENNVPPDPAVYLANSSLRMVHAVAVTNHVL